MERFVVLAPFHPIFALPLALDSAPWQGWPNWKFCISKCICISQNFFRISICIWISVTWGNLGYAYAIWPTLLFAYAISLENNEPVEIKTKNPIEAIKAATAERIQAKITIVRVHFFAQSFFALKDRGKILNKIPTPVRKY